MYMYQHSRLKTNRLGFFQKFRNFDYILLFCIIILGFISLVTMYSTDGGQVLFHTKSHFTKLIVFTIMMLIISFINNAEIEYYVKNKTIRYKNIIYIYDLVLKLLFDLAFLKEHLNIDSDTSSIYVKSLVIFPKLKTFIGFFRSFFWCYFKFWIE